MFQNKKFLIAGGAGFIGVNITRRLLDLDAKVFCIDNLSSCDANNYKQFVAHKNYNFLEQDICNFLGLDERFDYIINLACPASPDKYESLKLETIKACTIGLMNLLEFSKRISAKFIFTSTSEIYGASNNSTQSEIDLGLVNTFGERSCYKEAKRCAETICYNYSMELGMDIIVFRIFNTYGPYMNIDDGRVISNFIRNAISKKPIEIHGNGHQTRSFCYIDDLVKAILIALSKDLKHPMPINLGSDDEHKINDLCMKVINLEKSPSDILYLEARKDDVFNRKPNISLIKDLIGWKPETSIDNGLTKTYDYFKKISNIG